MSIIKKDIPAEYRILIQKLRLIDDTFFNVCFDNYTEGMQLLLRIFFDRDDLVVRRVVTQQSADNLYGRGVRFDVLAEDSEGKLYDCEVQRANEGATLRLRSPAGKRRRSCAPGALQQQHDGLARAGKRSGVRGTSGDMGDLHHGTRHLSSRMPVVSRRADRPRNAVSIR